MKDSETKQYLSSSTKILSCALFLFVIFGSIFIMSQQQEQEQQQQQQQQKSSRLRVTTCNVLFEEFYKRWCKTKTRYPPTQRSLAFARFMKLPPLVNSDVLLFQEFAFDQKKIVEEGGFEVFLSSDGFPSSAEGEASSNHHASTAYVAVALNKTSFALPPLKVESMHLEEKRKNLGKVMLGVTALHKSSGRNLHFASAHVPWQSKAESFKPNFEKMSNTMMELVFSPSSSSSSSPSSSSVAQKAVAPVVASFVGGDFNVGISTWASSMTVPKLQKIFNAVPDLPFSAIPDNNKPHVIDQLWFTSADSSSSSSSSSSEVVTRVDIEKSPSIVVPSKPDEMVRHGTKEGFPDFVEDGYFSDHAIVSADFDVKHL